MKSVSANLEAHLAQETTTLCTCWKLTRQDAEVFYFTDHDQDLTFEGQVYKAAAGYTRTAVSNDSRLNVDELDIEGILIDGIMTKEDLRAGLFDHAEVLIFLVNWNDTSMGKLKLRRGWLGEVTLAENGTFKTELRGLTQALQQTIGEFYTAECRADLGDSRCTFVLTLQDGTVTATEDQTAFECTIDGDATNGRFNGGVLTWVTGDNAGLAVEVKDWTDPRLETYLAAGYPIQVGDTFTVHLGCDKRFATCRDVFDNAINFRGEPYVPGVDGMMRT